MKIVPMVEGSYNHALEAWNEGFQDYSVNVQADMDGFIRMLASKRLSPAYSFLVYDDEKPIGIILNGIKDIDGVKTAYNGGTAVHPAYRNKGVARLLVANSLELYKKKDAEIATLEAISDNAPAIRLYEKFGYEGTDQLHIMRATSLNSKRKIDVTLMQINEKEWEALAFERRSYPWQNQSASVDKGQYFKVLKSNDVVGGIILSHRKKGHVLLFQLQSTRKKEEEVCCCLEGLCTYFPDATVDAFNIPEKSDVFRVLKEEGFDTMIQQVWMKKVL